MVLLDSAYNNIGGYSYGVAKVEFSLLKKNYPHNLQIMKRNSVDSWSQITSTSGDTLKYDFTSSLSQIYGNNAILVNGAASFYSGDIASPVMEVQDGCVDLTDIIAVHNALIFLSGPYVLSDLNYDGLTDLTDIFSYLTILQHLYVISVLRKPQVFYLKKEWSIRLFISTNRL